MANYNKILLIGNLTRDPQLSYLPSQTAVVEFGMATNRKWTSQSGEQREEVCFVDCQAFGKPAETLNKYMSKGQQLFIEGRLKFEQWTAQDGTKRSKHRITVENFQFLGSPRGQGAGQAERAGRSNDSAEDQSQPPVATDDDIPF